MTGAEMVAELEAHGHRLRLDDAGHVVIIPPPKPETIEHLRPRKPEIIAELHRRNDEALQAEWRVDHATFVVAREVLKHGTMAACIACGGTWELHGRPPRDRWQVAEDPEAVELLAVQFVQASARAIATEGAA